MQGERSLARMQESKERLASSRAGVCDSLPSCRHCYGSLVPQH
eukprot:COSAG05_NODE_21782_length_269_cov_0.882353_1_plen_42_part_10